MADTLTPNIELTNQEAGANNNTWGNIADANFEQIDDVLGDTTALTTTGGTTVLTDGQEFVAIIEVDGTLVSNATLQFSGRGGFWMVKNATGGSFSLTCKVSGQTGVEISQNDAKLIYCNGTDIEFGNPAEPTNAEVTVASATTTNILEAASEFIAISGTATITGFGSGASRKRFVRATGAFTITHHATTLICPGGRNITCAAGDTFIVVSDASSNARVFAFQRATGKALIPHFPIGGSIDYYGTTEPDDTRWLLLSAKTIGNVSSGATARASSSADTEATFTTLYNAHGNTELPIQDSAGTLTTRGANAAADFAANKRLPLPDARGRFTLGRDTMGGSAASRVTSAGSGIDAATMGVGGGSQTVTLVVANLPPYTPAGTNASSTLTVNVNNGNSVAGSVGVSGLLNVTTTGGFASLVNITASGTAAAQTFTGTAQGGASTAINKMPPLLVCNKIIYAGLA